MIDESLAPSGHESIPDYEWRGRGLFTTYSVMILESYQGGGRWIVPSGREPGTVYVVRVGTRPERTRCECRGFASHEHCSHVVAAGIARKKSAVCDSCGERRWWKDLTEVQEDDELLAWFPGDVLCSTCVPGHWA